MMKERAIHETTRNHTKDESVFIRVVSCVFVDSSSFAPILDMIRCL